MGTRLCRRASAAGGLRRSGLGGASLSLGCACSRAQVKIPQLSSYYSTSVLGRDFGELKGPLACCLRRPTTPLGMLRLTRLWAPPLNPGAGGAALRKKRVGRDVRAHHSLLPLPAVRISDESVTLLEGGYVSTLSTAGFHQSAVEQASWSLVAQQTRELPRPSTGAAFARQHSGARSGFQPTQPTPPSGEQTEQTANRGLAAAQSQSSSGQSRAKHQNIELACPTQRMYRHSGELVL